MRSLILLAIACLAQISAVSEEKRVVCYYGSWSVYRPEGGKFAIENIDTSLCTHLIYSFVGIDGSTVKALDQWQDLATDYGKDGFRRFNALRKKNSAIKTLVAIGGWNEGSEKYSKMAQNPSSRFSFIHNAVAFVKKHNFDGFDLDWEYPAQRGGSAQDFNNLVELIKEMRQVFDKEGLLLTAAVAAAQFSASQSYDIPSLSKYLHFINLMTYDLHGSWESQTGLNAPLYPGSSDTAFSKQLTIDGAVRYWLRQGVDPSKLNLGIASYGRTFTLSYPSRNSINSLASGPGTAGVYTREKGFLGYNEICDMQRTQKWTIVYDQERRAPYAYLGNQWVGYDDPQSIMEKAEYIKKMGLGGAMMWSIETDDFKGNCGETYPLLKTLNRVLRSGVEMPELPKRTPVTTTTFSTIRPSYEEPPNTVRTTEASATSDHEWHWEPTTPSYEDGSGVCVKEGNIADPLTCEHFFQCVSIGDGKFVKYVTSCSPGLCYKPADDACEWP